eukprot:11178571-Lingulodinium_polyedra.AAC.1
MLLNLLALSVRHAREQLSATTLIVANRLQASVKRPFTTKTQMAIALSSLTPHLRMRTLE